MSLLVPGLEVAPGLVLSRRIGGGGMGEVWLARDQGEPVVAKIVPSDAPAERAALLRREARLLAGLAHPRVVSARGLRSSDRGSILTFPYVPGGDAGRRRGAAPLDVVRIGRDVAEALDYLHGRGVVHRDVKPSNVLLDAAGRAQLADFGIASVSAADEEGVVLRGGGSRGSMSPQQLAGKEASPADDLYGLGALLFELLAGRPPSPPEVPAEPMAGRAPAPGAADPVPAALRELVRRLLAPSVEARPASAREVVEALSGIERELSVAETLPLAPRLQPPPRVADDEAEPRQRPLPPRAGRIGAGQAALLAALALAAAAAVWWLPRSGPVGSGPAEPAAIAPSPSPVATRPSPNAVASAAAANDAPPARLAAPRPRSQRERVAPEATPTLEPLPSPAADRAETERLARHRDAALAFEAEEQWRAALAEYEAALALDPRLRFAQEGKEHATERALLAERLESYLASPHRLAAEAVAREAEALLLRGREIAPTGPRLRALLVALEQALAAARTAVEVAIESDGLTEVSVSRVGRLGTLTRRVVALRPGQYVATGSRRGYRDVRVSFTVVPGAEPPVVAVRCKEAL